ncbi:hypothetical protein QVD17_12869 [Tagetes erecta]|uniref:Uncharacterized protein n=1 Tax=Tagetes erecta TaxID=13708 RepID=A0AAD8KZG1_TARER|nr:hypothetical protein QVD17_12869 [Tagetes erecta]
MSFMEMTNVMNMQHRPEYQNIGVQSGDSPRMEQSAAPTVSISSPDAPSSFRLPAASPYDNFLKVARRP